MCVHAAGWGGEHSPAPAASTTATTSAIEADATRALTGPANNELSASAAAPVLSIARALPLLQRLRQFVARAERVLRHILWQLAALLTPFAPQQSLSSIVDGFAHGDCLLLSIKLFLIHCYGN